MKPTDFFRALDLPAHPLKPGFRRPRASRSNHYAVFNAEEILTEATLSRFHALGLRLGTAALKPLWAAPHRPSRLSVSSP